MSGEGDGGGDAAILAQFADGMADQMDALHLVLAQAEAGREMSDERLGQLAAAVHRLSDSMTGSISEGAAVNAALMRVADGQERLAEVLTGMERGEGLDAESRMRLRSMDVQLLRILEEISAGRQDTMSELRTDLAALTRAVEMLRVRSLTPRPLGGSAGLASGKDASKEG